MKIKTSELTEAALDWVVAECKGWEVEFVEPGYVMFSGDLEHPRGDFCAPSTDWSQGGPIMNEAEIGVWPPDEEHPYWTAGQKGVAQAFTGPTCLIAAMRCYVASEYGDEVEVPDGLS